MGGFCTWEGALNEPGTHDAAAPGQTLPELSSICLRYGAGQAEHDPMLKHPCFCLWRPGSRLGR